MCSFLKPINTKTHLLLLIHHREMARTTNTGSLAKHILTNSELCLRGLKNKSLELSKQLKPNYQALLLYPSDDAEILNKDYLKQFTKPIQLIVPDGNWRQASKVHTRHKELQNVPRVKLPEIQFRDDSKLLRKESKPNGMATLQAIAYAFGALEDELTQNHILKVYREKLERTLKARGTRSQPNPIQ